jgi:hypothetical protein
MAYNFVTVNLQVSNLAGSTGSLGGLHFQVSDLVLDKTTGAIIIVPPIDFEANGGFTGNPVQIPFLAMDDPALTHNWAWLMTANVPGVTKFPIRKLTINFAAGAVQDFATIAQAATIVA